MRRGVLVGGVIAGVVGSAGVGWFAGRNIKSPAELAAEAQPPEPSLITVAVELTELSSDVIIRADIGYDQPTPLTLGGSLGGRPNVLVVTAAPEEGAVLEEGVVAVEISGRPVLVLQGEIPVYRDLRPGADGVDVLQLEEALARLGHFTATADETWDDDTAAAVAIWYEAAGYTVNGLTDEQEAALDAARAAVKSARAAVTSADKTRGEALLGPSAIAILSAEGAVAGAEDQLRFAQTNATASAQDADEAIRSAEFERDRAAREFARAQTRWLSAQSGVHPDTGALPTPLQLEELRLAFDQAAETLRLADRAIVLARTAKDIGAIQQAATIRSADDQLALARAQLEDLLKPVDTENLDRQVSDAASELAAAQSDLAALLESTGTWIPAGELIFLKRVPVRVDLLTVERGDRVESSLMTVSGSDLALRGAISAQDLSLVKEGAEVRIEDSSLTVPIPGVVRLVDSQPNTHGVGPERHYIEIVADDIPDVLVGANVKVVIPVSSTAGEVLAVPAAALSATADGSTRVEVDEGDGTTRFVVVEPGLAADGLVEIAPLEGEIAEGDLVVVGLAEGS